MTTDVPTAIPIITSIAAFAAGTEAWFVDIWGVMHNGIRPFDTAVAACSRFRREGGTVLLVSNSPRPGPSVMAQLDRIGVAREAYDAIVSSGDVARELIAAHAGEAMFHIGPERDLGLFDRIGVDHSPAETARVIVCSGLFKDETETPDDYTELLTPLAARGVPMVCANPDLKVERGGEIIYCAGAIAQRYEDLGGTVAYAGKPYLPIYQQTFARLGEIKGRPVAADKVLAIGDGVKTDIAGAAVAGVRSVFIASGLHVAGGKLNPAAVASLFANLTHPPIAAMPALVW